MGPTAVMGVARPLSSSLVTVAGFFSGSSGDRSTLCTAKNWVLYSVHPSGLSPVDTSKPTSWIR